ncbi:hypothetical protein J4E90_004663 [Alternaria incomplexa]|uniref:uncharacterized protein n=1 Tax=Alternaria incomplexa TaxID=1187928 RepID=UPI00221EF6BE|nr:uncharacterized protein J4E90_004663 [Alternaria incomplexa]KAI4914632.1 hypothetical protein J4E90_004663 [Alternaria incomplexa]
MAEPTMADLKDLPAGYTSSRDVGDVLVGQDDARRLIETCSSGDDTALWSLLSQPQHIATLLSKPHTIYYKDPPRGKVMARPIPNLERTLMVAAQTGHAAVVTALLAFATEHSIPLSDIVTREVVNKAIDGGHAAAIEALGAAYPKVTEIRIGHGHERPLYEAVRRRKPDVVAALLELGADPLNPVAPGYKKLGNFRSSLMSFAAMNEGPRTTAMLLERGTPIAGTAALHTAARFGQLDTMRLLIKHGADLEEVVPGWKGWTPMHFAASTGKADAMKLLVEHSARINSKDEDGKTPKQLLDAQNAA